MRNSNCVTGAFSYSGKFIAKMLLEKNEKVITLTNSTDRDNFFNNEIQKFPLNFNNLESIEKALSNAHTLYNTYWVRFNTKTITHKDAFNNTIKLFDAAKKAGVQKIIHISILNPDKNSSADYYKYKALLEEYLFNLGVSYTILQPTIIFGEGDSLINNIAWTLRKFPILAIFDFGKAKLQPISVLDLASLAVNHNPIENEIINANGPETYTYLELLKLIKKNIGSKNIFIPTPHLLAFLGIWTTGKILGDQILTYDEMKGLLANKLYSEKISLGKCKLSEYIQENASKLGISYINETKKRA